MEHPFVHTLLKLFSVILRPRKAIIIAKRTICAFLKYGSRGPWDEVRGAFEKQRYRTWAKRFDSLTDKDRALIRKRIEQRLSYQPLISVVMPVYNIREDWLRDAIESVRKQLYPKWELCIADDHSPQPHVRKVLEEYQARDSRIKVVFRERNGHISESSNSALSLASGEFTALMDHDDVIPEHALYMLVEVLNQKPEIDLLYSDEDKIDVSGVRYDPHFKSDWNEDLFFGLNLITHFCAIRTSILHEIGGFRKGYEGSQDYDLMLRVLEKTDSSRVRHIPHILYHWRAIPGSVALSPSQKNYAHEAARKAIQDHFDRIGRKDVKVTEGYPPLHRARYPLSAPLPLVTVIICTDCTERVQVLIGDLEEQTDYSNIELVIVNYGKPENQKDLKGKYPRENIRWSGDLNFSQMRNEAVKRAKGDLVLFLADDLRVTQSDWLKEVVSHALRQEVGAVGTRLLYANGDIRHAGVLLGVGGLASFSHQGICGKRPGYMGRNVCVQQYSAVSWACMAVRRTVFADIGGFDESNLPDVCADIDFCLRLREHGYRVIWTPFAELQHSGLPNSKSDRFVYRSEYMKKRWAKELALDPFYNPNFDRAKGKFTVAFPPHVQKPWRIG